ncbi:MAG: transcription termination/antitermination protein NusA [Candidatus Kerfeldbacteria bacterium CG_4_10_14_0_8_um_filter_42_10]|uniref:Transcription termination/antitermination protein NusA n=1 Tax=Candidatus Kerfeldbacteria bacterium CG_4_10_14_0_8_um_filter_42_10 TaxID=2014248 RepID=A0A2M7RJL3_9BACT|nr:MAG: transcription termination/antitermination protein NusA [Candidatus Kerfeldbacteria bacterium CG_4_10_14_0_8_um_filter_42_10]
MSSEIQKAIKQICDEKNISEDSVIETIESALAVAYRKDFGEKNQNIKVEFNLDNGQARVFDLKTVVEDISEEELEKAREKEEQRSEEEKSSREPGSRLHEGESKEEKEKTDKKKEEKETDQEPEEEEERKKLFNPKTDIMISEAKKIKKDVSLGDEIRTELFPSAAYGRMAAQTAKQVIIQKLREAERDVVYQDYKDREGEIISGVIQRVEGRVVLVDIGQTTAIMPPKEQIEVERYNPGQREKFYLVSVTKTTKGPEIIVSRSHPEMVKKLFTMEVPEIASGAIEIKAVAREAGSRSKIAVQSKESNIDPVGSCVGQRGTRVQTIIAELGGEKIDIIEYDEDPVKFIVNALSPAKVVSVELKEEDHRAITGVKADQLSLAIGRSGQNVRLSAKLTGWKIDVVEEGAVNIRDKKESEEKEAQDSKEPKKEAEEESKKEEQRSEEEKSSREPGSQLHKEGPKEEKEKTDKKKEEKEPKEEKKEKKQNNDAKKSAKKTE